MVDPVRIKQIGRRLYERASERDGAPIENAWEFWRVAYDCAVGARWDDEVDRPFIEHAPRHLRREAYQILQDILENPGALKGYLERSGDLRGDRWWEA